MKRDDEVLREQRNSFEGASMKIMYVGCNPAGAVDLLMDSEVTGLARLFRGRNGEPVEFLPFPRLPIEELPLVIASERADILHVAAHARNGRLIFANAAGHKVELGSDELAVYLKIPSPPTLVYLNACDSQKIARQLTSVVNIAIGTTSGITNRTARASAILFYDRILGGATVQDAFEAGRVTMATMQSKRLTSAIYSARGVDPGVLRLYQSPCLVARFVKGKYTSNKKDEFQIEFGIAGCPSNTSQVVFFWDETADVKPIHASEVVRGTPVDNVFWNDDTDEMIFGDYRAYATGTTTGGVAFTVGSTVCTALEVYFKLVGKERAQIPKEARQAIETLRRRGGANLPTLEALPKKGKATKAKSDRE